MKALSLYIILFITAISASAQSWSKGLITDRITVNHPDETITAFVKPSGDNHSTDPTKFYTWYSAGRIRSTQGGYSGKLLNGPYTSYYTNKNIKEQGDYSKGLKNGSWNHWNENGTLKESFNWNAGVKHGRFSEYDGNGSLLKSGSYRKGLLHGNLTTYIDKDSTQVTYYKKGLPAEKKKIRLPLKKLVPGFLRKKEEKENVPL